MSNKKFEIVLDFLVNLKSDKAQVERLARETEKVLGLIKPEIDFNSAEIKKGISQVVDFLVQAENGARELEKALSALDLDLNTDEAKKALSDIESALKEINKADLSGLDKAFKGLTDGSLDDSIRKMDEALKDLDADKFDKEVEQLAESFLKAKRESEELIAIQKAALIALKASGQEGSESYRKLQNEIAEAENVLKKFDTTADSTKGFGDRMATFGMAAMGIEQITSTLQRFQEPFIELDKQVRNIGTLGVKNFQEFADAATDLSRTVPDSAGEIAQGVYDAISAGTIKVKDGMADVTEGMVFVETASKLATAGLTSTQDAINGLTSVMNAYGIEAGKAGDTADIFFGAVNVGKTTIPELNASLSNVIPTAAAFGVEFNQVAAAIATMTKQGTPTAQATTQIRAALTELAKPGATLAPIMQKAGVSLESLRKEGLQESMRKIGLALESTGKSATQVFSSVEAAGAVMLLSGKNAQMAADDFQAVAGSIGSTDAAFAVASEGIGNKTKMLMNSVQAGFNSIMDSLGSVGQTALATATQIAPLVTSFSGISQMIPDGAISKAGELGKTLIGKLVPALSGATTAQGALNSAVLVNPYILAIAGIAALVTGLHFLSDALHETAAEKLDDAKADQELLKSKIETNRQQRELAQSNIDLVESFRKQGASAMQNDSLLLKLASSYPGVINQSKSYAENLTALEAASKKNTDSLNKLNSEMVNIANQSIKLDVKLANLELDTAKEDIENQLTDAFGSFLDGIDEFILGTSDPRKFSESIIKNYTKGIYNAKDDASLQKANLDFQMAVFNDKNFQELDNKQKQQIIKSIQQMTAARKKAIDEQNRSLEKDMADFRTAGFKENEVVDLLSKKYGKTKEEVQGLIKKQQESKAETEKQVSAVDKLAEAWSTATAEVDKNIKSQLGAANEVYKKMQDKSMSKEQRAELQKQYNEAIKNLKDQAKEKKNLDKIDELNQIRAGLKEKSASSTAKSQKTALELAKEEAGIIIKCLEVERQNYEYVLKNNLLRENRKADAYDELLLDKKQLETVQNQKQEWERILISKKLIKGIEADGKVIFVPEIKEADKAEISSIILDLNEKIQDSQGKIQDIKIKLMADDKALEEKLSDLEKQKIDWEISIGIKPEISFDDLIREYNDKIAGLKDSIIYNNEEVEKLTREMNDALSQASGDDAEQEREIIRIRYGMKIREIRDNNLKLMQEEYDTQKKIRDTETKSYETRLDTLKKFEEESLKHVEDKYKKEEDSLKRFNEVYYASADKKMDSDKNETLKKIEDEEKAKIKELEKWRDMQTISAEEFEKRKADIEVNSRKEREKKEEEYRRTKLRQDAQKQSLEIELQRKKDQESLSVQKKSLKDQLSLLESKAKALDEAGKPLFDSTQDAGFYAKLQKQLEDTESLLKEKGNSLGLLVTGLQTTVTDSLTNLFAGDPDAAADSWRKFFAQLAGMLQAKASAFVLDMILSPGTMQYISAIPFPGNVIAIPVITGVVNAAVKAITDPIISSILSFSSGGRVDQPTLALIGDASRQGGKNREWIFRDEHLIATVKMASAGSNSMLLREIRELKSLLASQELTTTLRGSDIDVALKRHLYISKNRSY